jgi:hypothetical protein
MVLFPAFVGPATINASVPLTTLYEFMFLTALCNSIKPCFSLFSSSSALFLGFFFSFSKYSACGS